MIKKTVLFLIVFTIFINNNVYAEQAKTDWPQPPNIKGEGAVLMEADTASVIYSMNPDKKLYPASITKIMTALLAVENLSLNDEIVFTDEMIKNIPLDAAKLGVKASEKMTVNDCLHALLLRSSNDIAVSLAIKIAGSEAEFAKMMTKRAKELGALNTNFSNSTGLHSENHYTTARDMALITKGALSNPDFSNIFCKDSYLMHKTNMVLEDYTIWHRHDMLVKSRAEYYQYAKGGKTGYTDEAGKTLVTYASKDGINLISVILFSDNETVFKDTRSLFEYGFNNFKKISVKDNENRFSGSSEGGFKIINSVFESNNNIFSLNAGMILIPNNFELSNIDYEISKETNDESSIAKIVYKHGEEYLSEAVLYKVSSKSELKYSPLREEVEVEDREYLKESIEINVFYILAAVLIIVIIIIFLVFSSVKKRKRRGFGYIGKR